MIVTAGKTNVTVPAYFVDDDGGTAPGEPTTGLLFSNIETGGSASYQRQGAARVDFTLVTQTVAGAHTDGGFVLIDDTNMPGTYRLDAPDAAFATGVDFVIIQLVAAGANNTVMRPLLVDLTDVDLRDSVRGGMTALPNAAADAAGGLPISDLGGLDLDTQLAATNEVTAARMGALTDWINGGRLDLILDIIAADVTGLAGAAMRGTDGAFLAASAPTNFSSLAITAGGVADADMVAIATVIGAATNLEQGATALVTGAVVGTPTTTVIDTDLTEATTDHYKGRIVTFTSGAIAGQSSDITSYNGTTKELTVTALTDAPAATDTFVIS